MLLLLNTVLQTVRAREFIIIKEQISCRSEEGITIGIIDSFINGLRLFKDRDLKPKSVQEALLDIGDDPDFDYFLSEIEKIKQTNNKSK